MELLRLAVLCSLLGGSDGYVAAAWRQRTAPHVRARRAAAPLLAETETAEKQGGGGGGPLNFFAQKNVPQDQQPVFELQNLRGLPFYAWAESDEYDGKIRNLYFGLMFFLSLPISYVTFPNDPAQLLISAHIGTCLALLPFVFRLRTGWGFVAARLRDRSTYYEANGAGFLSRKDRETVARDKLIGKTQLKPVIDRLNKSLITVGSAAILGIAGLDGLALYLGEAGPMVPKIISGEEAISFTNRLRSDEEFAKREQKRYQQNEARGLPVKPGYCDSRYYKILAGGNGQGGVGCQ